MAADGSASPRVTVTSREPDRRGAACARSGLPAHGARLAVAGLPPSCPRRRCRAGGRRDMADRAAAGGHGPVGRAHPGRVGRTVSRRGVPVRLVRRPLSGRLFAAGPLPARGVRHAGGDGGGDRAVRLPDGLAAGRHRVPRARAAAVWAAVALCTELTAGGASFTVAVPAAFGCVLAAGTRPRAGSRWRARAKTAAVVMLALLTSMLSPVAGLFLGVAAAALVVCGHRRPGLYMGLAAAVLLSVTLAIPGTGRQPIGIQDLFLPLIAVAAVLAGVPRQWRVIPPGAAIYPVGTLAAWLLPTAVGANADRLPHLLARPLLLRPPPPPH